MCSERQRGLTIIELVMFMVIVGVAAAGIIGLLNFGNAGSADPLRRKQAMMIAEAFMEEVQLARFTLCVPGDQNAASAAVPGDCTPGAAVVVGPRANGLSRPYANVADYATALNARQRTFAAGAVDVDVDGNALGNAGLAGITTTVMLNQVAAGSFGPAAPNDRTVGSADGNLRVLRITIRTTYGSGANDFVELDGYRTRYAPRLGQ